MWFVRALAEAGRDLAAVRQTLYRMEAEGESPRLVTRALEPRPLRTEGTFGAPD